MRFPDPHRASVQHIDHGSGGIPLFRLLAIGVTAVFHRHHHRRPADRLLLAAEGRLSGLLAQPPVTGGKNAISRAPPIGASKGACAWSTAALTRRRSPKALAYPSSRP